MYGTNDNKDPLPWLLSPCAQDLEDNTMNKDTLFYTFSISNWIRNHNKRAKHVSLKCPGYEFIVTKVECPPSSRLSSS